MIVQLLELVLRSTSSLDILSVQVWDVNSTIAYHTILYHTVSPSNAYHASQKHLAGQLDIPKVMSDM